MVICSTPLQGSLLRIILGMNCRCFPFARVLAGGVYLRRDDLTLSSIVLPCFKRFRLFMYVLREVLPCYLRTPVITTALELGNVQSRLEVGRSQRTSKRPLLYVELL